MLGRNEGIFALGRLKNELDRLLAGAFDTPWTATLPGFVSEPGFPAVNVWEDEASFHAEAELPGLKLEDLEILVVGSQLTIKGERRADVPEGATSHRSERTKGPFARVVRLPTDVAADKVEASLKDGVLLITLPKAEAARPRKIKVVAK
jgi:HSP20 family protein